MSKIHNGIITVLKIARRHGCEGLGRHRLRRENNQGKIRLIVLA
jgi:hypothetical protein